MDGMLRPKRTIRGRFRQSLSGRGEMASRGNCKYIQFEPDVKPGAWHKSWAGLGGPGLHWRHPRQGGMRGSQACDARDPLHRHEGAAFRGERMNRLLRDIGYFFILALMVLGITGVIYHAIGESG